MIRKANSIASVLGLVFAGAHVAMADDASVCLGNAARIAQNLPRLAQMEADIERQIDAFRAQNPNASDEQTDEAIGNAYGPLKAFCERIGATSETLEACGAAASAASENSSQIEAAQRMFEEQPTSSCIAQ